MTFEEFEQEQLTKSQRRTRSRSTTTTSTPTQTCDPCQLARVNRPRETPGLSSDNLDYSRCIIVDDDGMARYMIITEDGRWIPAEEF